MKDCIIARNVDVIEDSFLKSITKKSFLHPMVILSVMFFLNPSSGGGTIIYYGPTIFSTLEIGLPSGLLTMIPWLGINLGHLISYPCLTRMGRVTQYVCFTFI